MQCDKCDRESVIFQNYSGLHLCKKHFVMDVEAKIKKVIRARRWLMPGDHIAVVSSGDKNSAALLYFLKHLTKDRPDIRISAITIDRAMTGHHEHLLTMNITGSKAVDCIQGSFVDDPVIAGDVIAGRKKEGVTSPDCHVLRQILLTRIAQKLGASRLAEGVCLDDVAHMVLADILKGDVGHLIHGQYPYITPIPYITPLMSLPQEEVSCYADLHCAGSDHLPRPFGQDSFENDVDTMLADYTGRHPAARHVLLNLRTRLADAALSGGVHIPFCRRCGIPEDGQHKHCRILDEVMPGA
jgi:tRNA(Ile)-lysidine synthase TilS/MesJ